MNLINSKHVDIYQNVIYLEKNKKKTGKRSKYLQIYIHKAVKFKIYIKLKENNLQKQMYLQETVRVMNVTKIW